MDENSDYYKKHSRKAFHKKYFQDNYYNLKAKRMGFKEGMPKPSKLPLSILQIELKPQLILNFIFNGQRTQA